MLSNLLSQLNPLFVAVFKFVESIREDDSARRITMNSDGHVSLFDQAAALASNLYKDHLTESQYNQVFPVL